MHWTEGGDDYKFADYLTNWSKWGATFAGILANGPQSITTWNVALDERGRPNIGPFDCGGLVQIHSQTKEITLTGCIGPWCTMPARFPVARVIVASHERERRSSGGERRANRPASVVIHGDSDPNTAASSHVYHTAAKNSDGSLVLVLTNPGDAKDVTVGCADQTAKISLTADSITTLR